MLEGDLAVLKADLAPEIGLRVDDPDRARGVLKAHDLTLTSDAAGLVARLRPGADHDAVTAALNNDLVNAGVRVFAIGPRSPSLEGIYRNVTAPRDTAARQPETV